MRRLFARLLALSVLVAALGTPAAVQAGGGCHGTGAVASEASSTVVRIDGCTFVPTIDRVAVGSQVTFLNSGSGPHDVTGTMDAWGSPLLEPGESFATRFAQPGIYAYSCSLHPGMAGVVVAALDAQPAGAVVPDVAPAGPAEELESGSLAGVAVGGAGILAVVFAAALAIRRRSSGA